MAKKKLTDLFCETVKAPARGRIEIYDAAFAGLALRVTEHGRKSWSRDRERGAHMSRGTDINDIHRTRGISAVRNVIDNVTPLTPLIYKRAAAGAKEARRVAARVNGSEGTDHGTATVALIAGGGVKGGRVIADWPGLKEADLYEKRNLKATTDYAPCSRACSATIRASRTVCWRPTFSPAATARCREHPVEECSRVRVALRTAGRISRCASHPGP
jgi:hypothetical protein